MVKTTAIPVATLVTILICSCGQQQKEAKEVTKDASETASKPAASSEAEEAITETYRGTIPCADCSGIETTLSLSHKLHAAEGEYELSQKYLGKNSELNASGKWTTLRGNVADPDATIVELIGKSDKTSTYYLRRKDDLVMLDKNQNEIKSKLNYTLQNAEADRTEPVPFKMVQNYFLKNTVSVVDDPTFYFVKSRQEFDDLFGAAKTMTNKLSQIDFAKEHAIAIATPAANKETLIKIESVTSNGDTLRVSFEVSTGKEQSYSMQPVAIISVEVATSITTVNFYSPGEKLVKSLAVK